jgi:CBS domain-containing protein
MGMTKVQDVMTEHPVFCRTETTLAEATALMWECECGVLPVLDEEGRVTGIVTNRDICIALGTRDMRPSELTAGGVAHGQVFSCAPGDDIHDAMKTMRQARRRRLPVVDRSGGLVGILCLDEIVLRARNDDSSGRTGISYEDVVNTFRAICRRCETHANSAGQAA